MKSFVRMVAGMALALAAMVGNAQTQAPDTGFYVGGSYGQSNVKFDDSSFQVPGGNISKDESSSAWKIFAGYRLGKHVAVEGGWTDLGKFSATTSVPPPFAGAATQTIKSSGPHVEGVGILP